MDRLISFEALSKKVLIAPLHWGLGHATRCIPIIQQQLDEGNEVLIAASGGPEQLLKEKFPQLRLIEIPFMEITYPADGNMVAHFMLNGWKLLRSIWREHRLLQPLVRKEAIDLVISDSRFGLWTRRAKCVFITHQIEIQSPVFQGFINALNRWVMRHFDEVWIPDHEAAPGLAGRLSHPENLPSNARYIGPLSRFNHAIQQSEDVQWDAIAIISGPEPQRSLFEADTVRRFVESGERLLLLRGRPDDPVDRNIGDIRIVSHLKDEVLLEELSRCKKVIARSGYSTIMDLAVLGIEAELHPTPGQTEQEYLAELKNEKN